MCVCLWHLINVSIFNVSFFYLLYCHNENQLRVIFYVFMFNGMLLISFYPSLARMFFILIVFNSCLNQIKKKIKFEKPIYANNLMQKNWLAFCLVTVSIYIFFFFLPFWHKCGKVQHTNELVIILFCASKWSVHKQFTSSISHTHSHTFHVCFVTITNGIFFLFLKLKDKSFSVGINSIFALHF